MRTVIRELPMNAQNAPRFFGHHAKKPLLLVVLATVLIVGLGALLGVSTAQHAQLTLCLVAATLVLLVMATVGPVSLMLVLVLYAGFATFNVTSISLGTKTLFLTPGDIGLLVVASISGLRALWVATSTRRLALRLPSAATSILVPLVLLGLLFLVSSLVAAVGSFGTQINLARSLLFCCRWLAGPLIFILALSTHLSSRRLRTAVSFVAISLLTGFVGVLLNPPAEVMGILSPYSRMGGMFSDPNQLGQICVLLLVVLVSLSLTGVRERPRPIRWLLVAALALSVLLTQSREALVTLVVSLGVLWYILARQRKYLPTIFLTVLLAGAVVLALQSPRVLGTLTEIRAGRTVEALNGRDQTWGTALSMIAAYPLTGIGFENLSSLTGGMIWQAHNGFLQAAVVSGLWGLLVYGWLLLATGKALYRCSRSSQDGTLKAIFSGLFAVFVGYVFTALVSDHFITFYIYNGLFWGLTGLALAAAMHDSMEEQTRAGSSSCISTV